MPSVIRNRDEITSSPFIRHIVTINSPLGERFIIDNLSHEEASELYELVTGRNAIRFKP